MPALCGLPAVPWTGGRGVWTEFGFVGARLEAGLLCVITLQADAMKQQITAKANCRMRLQAAVRVLERKRLSRVIVSLSMGIGGLRVRVLEPDSKPAVNSDIDTERR